MLPSGRGSFSLPPSVVRAEVFADRIDIRWDGARRRILTDRRPPLSRVTTSIGTDRAGPAGRLNTVLGGGRPVADKDFQFGQAYRYVVRAVGDGGRAFLESDDSPAVDVLPKDVFPPSAPAGLRPRRGPDVHHPHLGRRTTTKTSAATRSGGKTEGQADFVRLTRYADPRKHLYRPGD